MLDIGVAEFLGGFGGTRVGAAVLVAAIGDDEGGFVGGKNRGKIGGVRRVVDGARDMPVRIGDRAVHVQQGDLLGGDRGLQIRQGDVGKRSGKGIGGDKGDGEEGEEFLHDT